jgi:hypothetical protein
MCTFGSGLCRHQLCWWMGSRRCRECWQCLLSQWLCHLLCRVSNVLAEQAADGDCIIDGWGRVHRLIAGSEGDLTYEQLDAWNGCHIPSVSSTTRVCFEGSWGQSILHRHDKQSNIYTMNKAYCHQKSSLPEARKVTVKSRWIYRDRVLLNWKRATCRHFHKACSRRHLLQIAEVATELVAMYHVMRECENRDGSDLAT